MTEKESLQVAQKIAQEFFSKMTFEVELSVSSTGEKMLFLEINTPDARVLIGERGQTLVEIQQLLNRIVKKQLSEEAIFLDLDINRYKSNKMQHLADLARFMANEAVLIGKEKILEPMPAFERRAIHLELSTRPDIETESIGEGEERRVIIRPLSFLGK
jgi:spoIIIJ-associated protein